MLGLLSSGSAETDVGRGENLDNDLIASCVINIFVKIIKKNLFIVLRVTIDKSEMFFSGFLFISRYISLNLLSLGSAEADNR